MKTFCENEGLLKTPRRVLISSNHAEEILLATPLLRWYLSQGLEVTRLHLVVEWRQQRCFESMTSEVADLRRSADKDPSKAVMGSSAKLLSNSVYGKLCENRARFKKTKYVKGDKLNKALNSRYFCSMRPVSAKLVKRIPPVKDRSTPPEEQDEGDLLINDIDSADGVYEVSMNPSTIKLDLPIQIPFFVYQYAKLRMLRLKYEVLDRYLDPRVWSCLYTDTDSLYFDAAYDDFRDLVRPETAEYFFTHVYGDWFPSECCDKHKLNS